MFLSMYKVTSKNSIFVSIKKKREKYPSYSFCWIFYFSDKKKKEFEWFSEEICLVFLESTTCKKDQLAFYIVHVALFSNFNSLEFCSTFLSQRDLGTYENILLLSSWQSDIL